MCWLVILAHVGAQDSFSQGNYRAGTLGLLGFTWQPCPSGMTSGDMKLDPE